jgi:hypothetical protein
VKTPLTVLLLPFLVSCSILDGFGFFVPTGPAAGECTDQDPFCGSSDFVDVCDTYGGEIDDGNEAVRTVSCVLPAQVSRGPCSDSWDLIEAEPREDARILAGFWQTTAVNHELVGSCFPATVYVMTEDPELHEAMHDLDTVDVAVTRSGPVSDPVVGSLPILDDFDLEDVVNSDGIPAIALQFCIPELALLVPSSVIAVVTFSDGSTTERRCLDRF